ncbi:REP-associated tyrosine transposase [Colwellia sp. 12G3]|uniref:REP-associated tyrosine transposase n=1 Tax=Colwellia sp. 12G3 TaxID=2058299 RepID=UPI000C327F36|nr:transposase [Colwellia sp. 12G3]PKI14769.1 transposase [Colwellia sp. 12G3]
MSRNNLIKGRTSLKHHVYHVTTCTQNRQPLFNDFQCARLLINEMKNLTDQHEIESITWVIMPDHLHWLFQLTSENSLSKVIQTLKGRSARVINQHDEGMGFSWQRGFYDHAIRTEESLLAVSRYIVANPLRARLVANVGDYPFWDSVYLHGDE